jgi:16S rRNA (guanine1207-N2)-methyltransferase
MVEHYFSEKPKSKVIPNLIKTTVRDVELLLHTSSGMFSPDYLDKASRLLIEEARVKDNDSVLDLGCAYGAVGIAIAKASPSTTVLLTDINERALQYAERNVGKNKTTNAKVRKSDGFKKILENFDVILLNPPLHAGKKICISLIQESFDHLNKGGSLQLVAYHNKGGSELEKVMKELFGNAKTLIKSGGIRVYLSEKSG